MNGNCIVTVMTCAGSLLGELVLAVMMEGFQESSFK